MGNVNRAEELRSMDDSDEFDFEALLNQNKEKLKQKYKNEKEHINNLLEIKEEKKGPKSKSKTIKQGIRNESLYEKKIK